jgi:threonine/homoserine/homoserine lactone efflux protein
MTAVLSFLLSALALTGSPGPNTLSVAAVGASFGRSRGFAYMLGLNVGMVGVIAIVATGVAAAVFAVPGLAPVVTALAVAYFLYLAYRIATAPPLATASASVRPPRWYEGAGLSLVNPKAYAAMAAVFSGHVLVADSPVADALVKTALLLPLICAVNLAWLLIGAAITRRLQDPAAARRINAVFAALLLISVALTLLA